MKNIMTTWRQFATWKRRSIASFLVVALIGGLGWLYIDYRFPSWDEEVMLSDGRMLIVHRQQEFIEGYGIRRTWLTFSLPETGGKQTWSEWMYPAIVDVHAGKAYVVGYTPGVKQFSSYANPRYQLVAYQWDGRAFARIPFMSVPEKIRQQWNVLYCSKRGENTTWAAKTQGWCGEVGDFIAGESRTLNLVELEQGAQIQARQKGQSGHYSE